MDENFGENLPCLNHLNLENNDLNKIPTGNNSFIKF
jgi:hypothetical protein